MPASSYYYGLHPLGEGLATFYIDAYDNQSTYGSDIVTGGGFEIDTLGPDAPIITLPDPGQTIYVIQPINVTIYGYEIDKNPNVKVLVQITNQSPILSPPWQDKQIYTSYGATLTDVFGDESFETITAVGSN